MSIGFQMGLDHLKGKCFHRHVLTFLKTAAVVAILVAIVPLSTYAATGSLSRAMEALRGYAKIMGSLCIPAIVLALLSSLIDSAGSN